MVILLAQLPTPKQWQRILYNVTASIGYVHYICLTVMGAFCVALLLIVLNLLLVGQKFDRTSCVYLLVRIMEWVFRVGWWMFAGLMGWGALTAQPMDMPLMMLRSLPARARPNTVTFICGVLDLLSMALLAVQALLAAL
jgi:hypothetical protein